MIKEMRKTIISGTLKDNGTWDGDNWVIDNYEINSTLKDFDGRNVRITIEEIND